MMTIAATTMFASFGFRQTGINSKNLGRSFHVSHNSVLNRCNLFSVSKKTHHNHQHHHHVLILTRRTLMTAIVEPSLGASNVPELPLTLILSEDKGFYGDDDSSKSWHQDFQSILPSQYGMSYGQFSMSPTITSLDQAMQELKSDLVSKLNTFSPSDVVLVTRGPWISWMAQFYLEDLPLAALVMVDPMLLDDQNGLNQFQLSYNKLGLESSLQYKLFQEYAEHSSPLKLEPGACPMMILYTNPRPAFKRCAENASLRHSDPKGPFGPVPVEKMPFTSKSHTKDSCQAIMKWVVYRAL